MIVVQPSLSKPDKSFAKLPLISQNNCKKVSSRLRAGNSNSNSNNKNSTAGTTERNFARIKSAPNLLSIKTRTRNFFFIVGELFARSSGVAVSLVEYFDPKPRGHADRGDVKGNAEIIERTLEPFTFGAKGEVNLVRQ